MPDEPSVSTTTLPRPPLIPPAISENHPASIAYAAIRRAHDQRCAAYYTARVQDAIDRGEGK